MKSYTAITCVFIALFFAACNPKAEVKVEKIKMETVATSNEVPVPPPPPPPIEEFSVAAYLVYEDGSLSTFDVLNDKTKALWNAVIGGGDTEKPTNSTKVIMTGKLDSLKIKIFNGKQKVIDQKIPARKTTFEIVLKNTGCNTVKILVAKDKNNLLDNDIAFHCGE